MNRSIKTVLFLVFIANYGIVHAQDRDFGTWMGLEVSKKVNSKLSIEAEEEVRILMKANELNRNSLSLGGSYKIFKGVKVGADYTWILKHHEDDDLWENRHRFDVYTQGKLTFGNWNIGLQEKFQTTYYDTSIEGYKYSPRNTLRSKIELSYKYKPLRIEPYACSEWHYKLNDPTGNEFSNARYTLGIEYRYSKTFSVKGYYRIDQELNTKNLDRLSIAGLTLGFKL